MSKRVVGYEFLLDFGDSDEWAQIQGSGGAIGNGALNIQDRSGVMRVQRESLRRARSELRRNGCITTLGPWGEGLVRCRRPLRILACRPRVDLPAASTEVQS